MSRIGVDAPATGNAKRRILLRPAQKRGTGARLADDFGSRTMNARILKKKCVDKSGSGAKIRHFIKIS